MTDLTEPFISTGLLCCKVTFFHSIYICMFVLANQ